MTGTVANHKLKRESFTLGQKNLNNHDNIFLPPLHIKLELMVNFAEEMNKHGTGLQGLKRKCLRITDAGF